jgi:hypothetical protein
MVGSKPGIRSQIAFLYHRNLEPVDSFYGGALGSELVEHQEWVKIYSVERNAFLGL